MFNNLIVIHTANSVTGSMDTSVPLSERLKSGGETLFLGMVTVFAVLVIIWLILELSSWIFSHDFKKTVSTESVDSERPTPVSIDVDGNVDDNDKVDDTRLAAAISAAVAAYMDAELQDKSVDESKAAFKVVSFKRLG